MYKPFINPKVFYWDCSDFKLMNKKGSLYCIFKLHRSLALQLTIIFSIINMIKTLKVLDFFF